MKLYAVGGFAKLCIISVRVVDETKSHYHLDKRLKWYEMKQAIAKDHPLICKSPEEAVSKFIGVKQASLDILKEQYELRVKDIMDDIKEAGKLSNV